MVGINFAKVSSFIAYSFHDFQLKAVFYTSTICIWDLHIHCPLMGHGSQIQPTIGLGSREKKKFNFQIQRMFSPKFFSHFSCPLNFYYFLLFVQGILHVSQKQGWYLNLRQRSNKETDWSETSGHGIWAIILQCDTFDLDLGVT